MITDGCVVFCSFDSTSKFLAENLRDNGKGQQVADLYKLVIFHYANGEPDYEPHGYSYTEVPVRLLARCADQTVRWEPYVDEGAK